MTQKISSPEALAQALIVYVGIPCGEAGEMSEHRTLGDKALGRRVLRVHVGAVIALLWISTISAAQPVADGMGAESLSAFDRTEQALLNGVDADNALQLANWISQDRQKVAGTEADHIAADMLEDRFIEMGLSNVRKEEFSVNARDLVSGDALGYALEGFTIVAPIDAPRKSLATTLYYGPPGTGPEGVTAELVDVGIGTNDDYAAAGDVTGKIVLVQRDDATWGWIYMQVEQAAAKGAAAMVASGIYSHYPYPEAIMQDALGGPIPCFSISKNDRDYLQSLMRDGPVVARLFAVCNFEEGFAYNVIGEIPGKKHPNQYIIFMAHYDNWWYGTNDDATGVGAMLDIAANIQKNHPNNDRTVMFIATSAEESGGPSDSWFDWLNGAYEFVKAHPELKDRVLACLNLDCISVDSFGLLMKTPELKALTDQAISDLGMHVLPWPYDCAQDSWQFVQVGFPGMSLYQWGMFYDNIYHTNLDTSDYTDLRVIADTERLYAIVFYRLDSAKVLGYQFDETLNVISANQDSLKTAAGKLADALDFSVVDRALANYSEANNLLKTKLSDIRTVSGPVSDAMNLHMLQAIRSTNSVIYEIAGDSYASVAYRCTEHVNSAILMNRVASQLEKNAITSAASALAEYTTMSWGKLIDRKAYMTIFPYWIASLNWGEQCGAKLVNAYDILLALSQMSGGDDVSPYLTQVLAWKEMFICEANADMVKLAQGFDSAAIGLVLAASLV